MRTYRITDYGVTPDSTALQTAKIQAVLDLCPEGGGTVIIPRGRFYTADRTPSFSPAVRMSSLRDTRQGTAAIFCTRPTIAKI